jgi:phosphorylcholine metabolism protein LicD
MNKHEMELDEILIDIITISKKNNIKIWLEAGTLLGKERNNDFIPWEKDIDFGAWNYDFTKKKYSLFKKQLQDKKYIVTKKFNKSNNLITIKRKKFKCTGDIAIYKKQKNFAYFKLNPIPITKKGKFLKRLHDIINAKKIFNELKFHKFGLMKINYLIIHYLFKWLVTSNLKNEFVKYLKKGIRNNSKDTSWKVPLKFLAKIKKKRFRRLEVYVPSKSLEYLKFRYGATWKKPRSDWNQFEEDKTMIDLNK